MCIYKSNEFIYNYSEICLSILIHVINMNLIIMCTKIYIKKGYEI